MLKPVPPTQWRSVERDGVELVPGRAVVDLKFEGVTPRAYKSLVERFSVVPINFSKYRLAVSGLRLIPEAASRSLHGRE
jgi:hypothetical protein